MKSDNKITEGTQLNRLMQRLFLSTILCLGLVGFSFNNAYAGFDAFKNLDASGTSYTLFNLANGDTIPLSDSATTKWDIGFKGTTLILNGGISGPGTTTGQVATSGFDNLLTAPSSGYEEDSTGSYAVPTGSGNGWYTYAGAPTHIIAPINGRAIVVKTTDGKYAKIEIISYYQGNPDLNQYTSSPPTEPSKYYTFRYYLQTDGSDNLDHSGRVRFRDLDATKTSYTLFSLSKGDTIPLSDSATTKWDIGFKGTTVILNGGISGPSTVTGQVVNTAFNNLLTAPLSGYVADSVSGKAIPTGSGNGWYTYAGAPTHKIEPIPNTTIAIQLANGKYAKVEIISYYQGNPDLSQYTSSPPTEPGKYYTFNYFIQHDGSANLDHSLYDVTVNDLDATGTNYALFSFTSSDTVPLSDSATTKWDIGFKGTTIILNGGVSGPGTTSGQVVTIDYDNLNTAPSSGFTMDGSGSYAIPTGSGNGWYTYAGPPTHKIEPIAGRTIVVQTTGGDYYKIQIISYYLGNPDLSQYTSAPPTEPSKYYTFRFEKISIPNGIEDKYQTVETLNIYPNPSSGSTVNIGYDLNPSVRTVRMSLYDLNGRIIHDQALLAQIGKQQYQLPISHLTSGIYMVVVSTNSQSIRQKLVIQ